MVMGAKRRLISRRSIFPAFCRNNSLLTLLTLEVASLERSKSRMNSLSVPTVCALQSKSIFFKTPHKVSTRHDVYFQGAQDGCTVTVCLARGGDFWIANAGDSRTVLVKQASVVQVSTDHKPGDPGEKARIVAAGGTVEYVFGVWRVNGMIVVFAFAAARCRPTAPQAIWPCRVHLETLL